MLIDCVLAVNPFGPVQLNVGVPVPPVTLAVNVAGAPWQAFGPLIVTCGFGLTTSVAELIVVQPDPSVMVTVYVPPTETLIVCELDVKPFGPVQLNVGVPVPPVTLAVNVAGAPWQAFGPLIVTCGFGLTASVAEAIAVQLDASVTVTV